MKKMRQYIVSTGFGSVGVTFSGAEERRVRAKATRLGVTLKKFVSDSIRQHVRAHNKSKRETSDLIVDSIAKLSKPAKRKIKR